MLTYTQLIQIKRLYNDTEAITIKSNIKRLMTLKKVKHQELSDLLEITIHTAYSYTNKANKGKPELYNLLIIAYYLQIDIEELFK